MPGKKTKQNPHKPFFLQQDEHERAWHGIHSWCTHITLPNHCKMSLLYEGDFHSPNPFFQITSPALRFTELLSIHPHSHFYNCIWAHIYTGEHILWKILALSHYLLFQIALCFFFFSNLIWKLIWGYECIDLHSYKLSIHQAFSHHGSPVIGDWGLVTAVSLWCFSLIFFLSKFQYLWEEHLIIWPAKCSVSSDAMCHIISESFLHVKVNGDPSWPGENQLTDPSPTLGFWENNLPGA